MGSSASTASSQEKRATLRQTNFIQKNRMNVKPAHRRTDSTATADPQNNNNNNNPQYYYNRSLPQPQKNPPPRKTVVEKNPEDGAKTQPKKRVTIKEDKDKNTNVSQNGKVKTNDKATPPKKTENKTTKKTQNTVKISVNGTDGKKKTEKAGEKKTEKAGEKKAPKPKPSPATPRRNVETARSEETPRRTAPMSRGGYSVQDSYISDEEDVEELPNVSGKEKIAAHLRSSRVPETKVRTLAVRISEETKKEQMKTPRDPSADVTKTLRRVIHKNLDTMLYGAPRKTKLRNVEDEEELVHKVAEMTELLESDLTTCFTSAQQYSHHDENTYGKSMPVVIQGAMQQLVTDHEILQQEHEQLQQEKEDAERANLQSRHKTEAMQESTFQLELEHQKLTEDNKKLKEHVSSLETEEETLRLTLQDLEQENSRLQKQVENLEENNTHLAKGLDKSQHTCAHLTVQVADQAKEIARLKDPDPEMVYRIQTLQSELTESKTANRKLELEKGAIKSNLQKLQASYNAILKERGILSKENIQLHKENELVKTTNKKLVLASQILR